MRLKSEFSHQKIGESEPQKLPVRADVPQRRCPQLLSPESGLRGSVLPAH